MSGAGETVTVGLVLGEPSCYIPAVARRSWLASTPHAVVAELVDALA
jgi:hypothetical protein